MPDQQLEAFAPLVRHTFTLDLEQRTLAFTLEQVRTLPHGARPGARTPFALAFRGPPGLFLPQHIYALRHDALGVVELFLVPIGEDENGVLYEAVFN